MRQRFTSQRMAVEVWRESSLLSILQLGKRGDRSPVGVPVVDVSPSIGGWCPIPAVVASEDIVEHHTVILRFAIGCYAVDTARESVQAEHRHIPFHSPHSATSAWKQEIVD